MITKDFHYTKDFPRIRGKSFVIMCFPSSLASTIAEIVAVITATPTVRGRDQRVHGTKKPPGICYRAAARVNIPIQP